MGRLFFYVLLIATLFVSFSLAKRSRITSEEKEELAAIAEEERVTAEAVAKGALRVGSANVLVPDASSEHPLIISNPEDQPLCKPNITLTPSHQVNVMEGYEFMVLANEIKNPRKIIFDQANHLLVMSPGEGLYSVRMDECGNSDIKLILESDEMDQPIGHGVAIFDRHIFVSTANSVYKFPYSDGQHSPIQNGVKVITNIHPDDPDAATDVAVDPFGHVFIPRIVTDLNAKVTAKDAMIKKFNLRLIPEQGFDYEKDGEIQALGANTQGSMGFDAQARLWGINGVTSNSIVREDLSSEANLAVSGIAEEMNLYEFPKMNYGYPYCMTEFDMLGVSTLGKGLGTQWGHPTFMNDTFNLDEYCQDETSNRPPSVPLPSNSYASSVHFYMGTFCSVGDLTTQGSSVGLPCNWTDTPIIANHGIDGISGGHNVVRIHFDDVGHKPRWDLEPDIILQEATPCKGAGCISPFGLAVDQFGRLFISSDETNEVFVVSRIYNQNAVQILTDRANADDGDDEEDEKKPEKSGDKDDEELGDKEDEKYDKDDEKSDDKDEE
ncbi:uncharacterized protein EV154DRAFT_599072 [Mucor mucedo]|uniref:uncharacterized protein n=1 Tax=Mucor mucedo TaxID=29922 RepID=UPI00221E79FB|nr:uncharacterized protein EV154DRAFT_599072 [Mucor mucedo]KAI7895459.1 hypothetical protein EV154DRAFT_599072 [Mucor mucedo]